MSPFAIEVAAIAIAISLVSFIVNKKVIDQKRMKEIKDKVSSFQKRYNEAKKSEDKALISELEKEQKDIMPLTMEMMKNSFKPMLYTFIPFVAVIYFLNGTYNQHGNIIDVPVLGMLNWFWWYFIIAIVTGIFLEIAYKAVSKK